jgi:hypothetical protein
MVRFTNEQTVDLVRDVAFELQILSVQGVVSNLLVQSCFGSLVIEQHCRCQCLEEQAVELGWSILLG